jgi:hypothetical protein
VPIVERELLKLSFGEACATFRIAAVRFAPCLGIVGGTVVDFSAHHALRLRQPHGILPSDAVAPVCRAT